MPQDKGADIAGDGKKTADAGISDDDAKAADKDTGANTIKPDNIDSGTDATKPADTSTVTDTTDPIVVVGPAPGEEVQIVSSDTGVVTELPLAPAQKAGFKLAIFILIIISVFLLILGGILLFKTFDASDRISLSLANVPDSTFEHQKDLIKALQEEKKNSRDFIVQISQMVLLNLLLPTLTAILGYIFGSREGTASRKMDS